MFCYRIVNNINKKEYIGITTDFERRMKQHKNRKSNSLIHNAILKYGEENFTYEILASELSIEEAEKMEIDLIKTRNTLAPNGYNLAKGGLHGGSKLKITDEQVAYIKNNRNLPLYVLYDEFSDLISYGYFKEIYKNNVRPDIKPTVEMYPHNLEFSTQFTRTKLTYQDVVDIRKAYANMIDWKDIYPKYKDKVAESTFFDVYRGQSFMLIMPEVFSEENKKKHFSLSRSGSKNGNAKLKPDDVKLIRKMHEEKKTNKEINACFPQVSIDTIRDIINYRTWKNI